MPEHRLEPERWRKSSRSTYGSCVEVRFVADSVQVRNSHQPEGPVLVFTGVEWDAFVSGVDNREFDRS